MNKVAVVFWSSTGNTEIMAKAIADGVDKSGGSSTLFRATEFNENMVDDFDVIAFGCPSMGAEQLEETEFEPMFEAVKPSLQDKKVVLFGSYDWGDGMWLRDWEEDTRESGANIVAESLMIHLTPEEDGLITARTLGETLAKA